MNNRFKSFGNTYLLKESNEAFANINYNNFSNWRLKLYIKNEVISVAISNLDVLSALMFF